MFDFMNFQQDCFTDIKVTTRLGKLCLDSVCAITDSPSMCLACWYSTAKVSVTMLLPAGAHEYWGECHLICNLPSVSCQMHQLPLEKEEVTKDTRDCSTGTCPFKYSWSSWDSLLQHADSSSTVILGSHVNDGLDFEESKTQLRNSKTKAHVVSLHWLHKQKGQ